MPKPSRPYTWLAKALMMAQRTASSFWPGLVMEAKVVVAWMGARGLSGHSTIWVFWKVPRPIRSGWPDHMAGTKEPWDWRGVRLTCKDGRGGGEGGERAGWVHVGGGSSAPALPQLLCPGCGAGGAQAAAAAATQAAELHHSTAAGGTAPPVPSLPLAHLAVGGQVQADRGEALGNGVIVLAGGNIVQLEGAYRRGRGGGRQAGRAVSSAGRADSTGGWWGGGTPQRAPVPAVLHASSEPVACRVLWRQQQQAQGPGRLTSRAAGGGEGLDRRFRGGGARGQGQQAGRQCGGAHHCAVATCRAPPAAEGAGGAGS